MRSRHHLPAAGGRAAACCLTLAICLGALALQAAPARAADTTEPFDPGAVDLESYLTLDSISRNIRTSPLTGELVLGLGLTRRLSVLVGVGGGGDLGLEQGSGEVGFGILGNLLDSTHLDLDLWLSACCPWSGHGLGLAPGLELNLDQHPEMQGVGLYLRAELPLELDRKLSAVLDTPAATLGGYLTLRSRHQLLLELEQLLGGPRAATARAGYNLALSESFELLTEVSLVLAPDAPAAVGAMVGFIATIPTRR